MSTPLSATAPESPEPVIARVRNELLAQIHEPDVEERAAVTTAARIEVLALWERPVRHFVPILAVRAAQARLQLDEQVVTTSEVASAPLLASQRQTASHAIVRPDDALDLAEDVIELSDDVL